MNGPDSDQSDDQNSEDWLERGKQNKSSNASHDSMPDLSNAAAATPNQRVAGVESKSRFVRKRIGPYKILQKIAEGGMGAVYMAEQEEPIRRRVALKIIRAGNDSDQILARFDAERQALAMMNHQNIAKILDAGKIDEGDPYFVMELVKGIPLTDYCDQNKLSINERLKLFVPVCNAVQHAHRKGIIHRDLKPSNVLVALYDGVPVPKVIDFGLAKATSHQTRLTDKTMFTEFGQVIGTLQYMSPEQAEMNQLDVDTRTDVYSLGVMLYELLTGSTPLDQNSLHEQALMGVLEMIREKQPPRPSTRLSESGEAITGVSDQRRIDPSKLQQILRGELDWIVMKSLEKDRTRRYESASAFAEDITRFLNDENVKARPQSTTYRLKKFVRKNRGLVASLALIATLLVCTVVGTTNGMFRAQREKTRADNKTKETLAEKAKTETALEETAIAKATAVANEKVATDLLAKNENLISHSNYILANWRWGANRPAEANEFLDKIPSQHRGLEWGLAKHLFLGSDLTCYGHRHNVTCTSFSPDGTQVLSGSLDGTIKIWDSVSGKEIKTFSTGKPIRALAFSPDGKTIASGANDNLVRIWSLDSGEIVKSLKGHSAAVISICFSPDGKSIASGSQDKSIKIWGLEKDKAALTLLGHQNHVASLKFSPDGTQIVSGGGNPYSTFNSGDLNLWDAVSGKFIAKLNEHPEPFLSVDYSPDGSKILSGGGDPFSNRRTRQIKVWDLATQKTAKSFNGHSNWVSSVVFSPDGSRIASASWDQTIKIWDLRSGEEQLTLTGSASRVHSLSFSPDGSRIASGNGDVGNTTSLGVVQIWDARRGERIRTLDNARNIVHSINYNSTGSQLIAAGNRIIDIWDINSGKILQSLKGHTDLIQSLSFSPNDSLIASGSRDKTVRVWDAKSGKQLLTLEGHIEPVLSVQFSPSGKRIVSSSGEYPRPGTVRIWDAVSGKQLIKIDAHEKNINGVAFNPEGTLIASASEDRTTKLWDANTGDLVRILEGHASYVHSVQFSPDGSIIATGGNGIIKLWDTATGTQLKTLGGHTGFVTTVSFSPDGSRLVSGSYDRTTRLWDIDTGEEQRELRRSSLTVYCVDFNPNGKQFAAASREGLIKLFEVADGLEIRRLSGHTGPVLTANFSFDGSRLYSESKNEKLVWDTESGTNILDAIWNIEKSTSDVARNGSWKAIITGKEIALIDLEHKESKNEKSYREFKARMDEVWHQKQADLANTNRDAFGMTFHLAWLLTNDPANQKFQEQLRSAYERLKDSSDLKNKSVSIPSVVSSALQFLDTKDESLSPSRDQ